MELSNDWQKRTNVRLLDILSDVLKEPKPPKVPQPTHGYTIAEKAPEIVTAPGAYFPAKKGEVIPLKPRQGGGTVTPTPDRTLREMVEKLTSITPRQNGGEVDPSLFKETFSVNSGVPTQQGIEAAANVASLDYSPLSPTPTLQSFAPSGETNPTLATPSTPSVTGAPVANPINKRLNAITGFLRSFMAPPPAFKENRRSPVFGSDQRAAYDKKWKPYTDFMEATKETPLFSRQGGGVTSPDPFEGLSEEERKKRLALLKTEFPVESLAPGHEPAVISPDAMREIRSSNSSEVPILGDEFDKKLPLDSQGNLSEIKKEVLPSGETRYTLPSTEGTATVGPERFFLKGKEVPTGTPGAVSGDEMARQRILKEAAPVIPELAERRKWATPGYREAQLAKARKEGGMISIKGGPPMPSVIGISPGYEKTYYEAHPEERSMDIAKAENKPLLDAFQRLIEENRRKAEGFGLMGMDPKQAAVVRAEATRAVPELTKGLEQTMAANQTIPEKYFSSEARVTEAERRGVAAAEARAATSRLAEKSPTELGLIAKAREIGPDGKPTPAAIEAKGQLDDIQKRKVELAEAQLDVKSKDIDVGAIADAIGEGQDARTAVKGSMGNPVASKAQSLVLKKYPKFNFNMSDANYKWKQSQTNQRTINFVGGSLPRVEALANQLSALKNTDIPAINAVMRQVSIQTGRPEYTNFESNRNAIVQEINTALSGSATGSDMRIKIELENLQSSRSPQQIIGAVNNLREALIARLDVDLSDIYPLEVVQGKKTLEEYKGDLFKKYRGKYGKPPEYETQTEGKNRPRAADFGGNPEGQKIKEPTSEWDKFWK
jgi:hypothetical protein